MSWWIPVIPSLLSLGGSTITVIGYIYINKLQKYNAEVKSIFLEKIQKLKSKNEQLEDTVQKLRLERQLINEELKTEVKLDKEVVEKVNHLLFGPLENEVETK
jgi:predicted RNase H-like nuclease (RuvC/YqgF family)